MAAWDRPDARSVWIRSITGSGSVVRRPRCAPSARLWARYYRSVAGDGSAGDGGNGSERASMLSLSRRVILILVLEPISPHTLAV